MEKAETVAANILDAYREQDAERGQRIYRRALRWMTDGQVAYVRAALAYHGIVL